MVAQESCSLLFVICSLLMLLRTISVPQLTVPPGGIFRGSVFGYGEESSLLFNNEWQGSGSFALAAGGDSVMAYCEANDGSVNLLSAVNSGSWASNGDTDLTSNESQLPFQLQNVGAVAIDSGLDNVLYEGITQGSKTRLLQEMANPSNWGGSNSVPMQYRGGDFVVTSDATRRWGSLMLVGALCSLLPLLT